MAPNCKRFVLRGQHIFVGRLVGGPNHVYSGAQTICGGPHICLFLVPKWFVEGRDVFVLGPPYLFLERNNCCLGVVSDYFGTTGIQQTKDEQTQHVLFGADIILCCAPGLFLAGPPNMLKKTTW